MRKFSPFFVALAAACSAAPVSYYGVAPPGREDAYQCAVAQLNIMGYTIEEATEGIVVKGRKQTSGLGLQLFTGNTHHDVLTATAYDNPQTGETNLRVTVTRIADQDASAGFTANDGPEEGEDVLAPSDTGKADAQALLQNCGVGNVMGPPPGEEDFALEGVNAPIEVLPTVDRGFAGDR
jgi:hypothetical protein